MSQIIKYVIIKKFQVWKLHNIFNDNKWVRKIIFNI